MEDVLEWCQLVHRPLQSSRWMIEFHAWYTQTLFVPLFLVPLAIQGVCVWELAHQSIHRCSLRSRPFEPNSGRVDIMNWSSTCLPNRRPVQVLASNESSVAGGCFFKNPGRMTSWNRIYNAPHHYFSNLTTCPLTNWTPGFFGFFTSKLLDLTNLVSS